MAKKSSKLSGESTLEGLISLGEIMGKSKAKVMKKERVPRGGFNPGDLVSYFGYKGLVVADEDERIKVADDRLLMRVITPKGFKGDILRPRIIDLKLIERF